MTQRFVVSESLEHVDIATEWQYAVVDTTNNSVFCQCKDESMAKTIAAALNNENQNHRDRAE